MTESVQKWLERNRPPRVKITYEVHTGGAQEKRELPFIVGVLADLSGDRSVKKNEPPPIKQRSMVPIDRDTFNDVMAKMAPDVDLTKVADTLTPPGAAPAPPGKLKGSLPFSSIDDFEPLAVVKAIPLLARQYDVRSFIRLLQSRAEASDELGLALDAMLQSGDAAKQQREALDLLKAPAATEKPKLPAHRLELWKLAALAAQKPDADVLTAAKAWGLMPPDPTVAGSPPELKAQQTKDLEKFKADAPQLARRLVEQMLRLFCTPDTPESLRQAQQALTNWAAPAPGPVSSALVSRLGLTDPLAADADAKALAAVLASVPDNDPVKLLAFQRARFASRVLGGLLAADDEDAPGLIDEKTSARRATERRHDATNRRFASALLQNLQLAKGKPAGVAKKLALINQLIDAALPSPDDERLSLMGALGIFSAEVLADPTLLKGKPMRVATAIDLRVEAIDKALGLQLNAVMHSDTFRALEATWRGLHYLVSRTETGPMLKLHVFNARQAELLDDMERAVDKDQSRLFKLIYEAEYGTFGGLPYSLLVGGYDIGRSPQDIEFLSKMAEIAASAHAPFIAAASPALFGLSSFRDLDRPRDLSKIFESADTAAWREFRETEDSRYVSLVLPQALLRLPYGGKHGTQVSGLVFEEEVVTSETNPEPNADRFLWGNAAYLLAERITHAFSLYNWTAAIRGVEGGGLVEGLPIYTYASANGAQALFCPTEVAITDRREKELNDLGFISLCHCKGKGQAAFFGGQTTNLPKKYVTDEANANALISARLPYMLAASRFAHYIKVIMRAKVGSFLTRANVESLLNTWIAQYVLLDENAMQEAKAAFPLSQARIVVTDVPGQPGAYKAVVFLRPHFQLEELTTSIRLVADLPKS